MKSIYKRNDSINGYKVVRVLSCNAYTEKYLVTSPTKTQHELKLYILESTPQKMLLKSTNKLLELDVLKKIKHNHFPAFKSEGQIQTGKGPAKYVVTTPLKGQSLDKIIQNSGGLSLVDSFKIFTDILHGLQHLHALGYCHNNITPANILLPKGSKQAIQIIELGHVTKLGDKKAWVDNSDLDVYYCAESTTSGLHSVKGDIFAATAVFYTMLFGIVPWESPIVTNASFAQKMKTAKNYRKKYKFQLGSSLIPDAWNKIIAKGLGVSDTGEYSSVEELLKDVNRASPAQPDESPSRVRPRFRELGNNNGITVNIKKGGGGFADIAGMEVLKSELRRKVLFVLQNRDTALTYKLTPPNGMLLYGPPGCGKTFFAEKFAEETGFNYMLVKPSDTSSIFLHGSQQKIGKLFDEAAKNAPIVLCFDEFDAFVPNRSTCFHNGESGEVNEFLVQLNNCSQRGIFVIATTNRPEKIDPAILRSGRMDEVVYVPMPDAEARNLIFRMHLKGRPYNKSKIDFEKLAELTDGYIASDIASVVNEAALTAAFNHSKITQKIIEEVILAYVPSLRPEVIYEYEAIRQKMVGESPVNPVYPIGYRIDN